MREGVRGMKGGGRGGEGMGEGLTGMVGMRKGQHFICQVLSKTDIHDL